MKIDMRQKAAELQGTEFYVDVAAKAVSINEEKHTATFVISTIDTDRHDESVDQRSLIPSDFVGFFWGHRSNEFPLGQWLRIWPEADEQNPGEVLWMGEAEFAVDLHADIERAWKHVVRGDIKMVSIGFIPHRVEYNEEKETFVLYDCELMECSLVGIGANRRAMIKDTTEVLIEAKNTIEATVPDTPVEVIRRRNAMALINKAIRQYKK